MAENNKTLEQLKDEAIAAANEVVIALNAGKGQSVVKDLKKAMRAKIDAHNEAAADEYYHQLATEFKGDAVRKALEAEEAAIPNCIGISIKATKEDVAYQELTTPTIRVDLYKMQKALGVEYFHSPNWFKRVNKLAGLMAGGLNKDLGGNAAFQYIIDESAKEFDLGEDADPTSKASMVKAFQKVIDDILWVGDAVNKKGEPVNAVKFTAKNWTYIVSCMTKEGSKTNEVVFGSPMKCMGLVTNCINVILRNLGYTIQAG